MQLAIIVLEDEPEVRDAVERDLDSIADIVRIEPAENVDDARQVVDEVYEDGDVVALILADHRMPGETGVDFLVSCADDERLVGAHKVLVTGQADQSDTIRAVNDANLDHYFSKPWDPAELLRVVRCQLTDFVVEQGLDPLAHMRALDSGRVMEMLRDYPE